MRDSMLDQRGGSSEWGWGFDPVSFETFSLVFTLYSQTLLQMRLGDMRPKVFKVFDCRQKKNRRFKSQSLPDHFK